MASGADLEVREVEVPDWLAGMEFCHVSMDGKTYCGAELKHGFCGIDYEGESICPNCGRPTCPRCAQLCALEDALL